MDTAIISGESHMRRAGRFLASLALTLAVSLSFTTLATAQGVTTSSINAWVRDAAGAGIGEARVTAVHLPSGTSYAGVTRADGRVTLPGLRVGGPYRITVAAIGYESQSAEDVHLTLGVAGDLQFVLRTSVVALQEILVTGTPDPVFSSDRTGAATTISRENLSQLPTLTGRIEDFTRLTPQVRGASFAGQDNRMNNITVDGSFFNNSFGLGGQPGDRTGVAPISIEAIEQVQINIAPYDVRQGNFVGAGVNTVTRSGTNDFRGSLYYGFRDQSLTGKQAGDNDFDPGEFRFTKLGVSLGGPIIRNRLFFFGSYEGDALTEPGTTFRANTGGQEVGGSITRVQQADLDQLSAFLRSNFGYETGPYQGYDHKTPATRLLFKLDYNLNDRNKFSLRYNHLDSDTDILVSNSSSLGWGNRRTSTDALNFQNSNYKILENIRSIVGEWNSVIGTRMANNLIVGYTFQDESRDSRGSFFPMVDILEGGRTYTTFGFEPFTPNNELRYKTWQLQNNFTIFTRNHDITFGLSAERYESENIFFPGSQSVYTYNSLADFYADANGYLANPDRTTSPVTLRRFQVRWSNIPGLEKPVQPLEVFYAGLYVQDEWRALPQLKLTLGLRFDRPQFGETGFTNPQANALSFRDELGATLKFRTEKLPDANLLVSPRLGFNWDPSGDRSLQVRGGTGIFTGRPAYVWISNQIGENGILTGFQQIDNTTTRPFHPDPNRYKPTQVSGAPATSYGLAFTDPAFRFPQTWRTNFAVDKRLPWDLVGTAEFLYSRDVNGIDYINGNLRAPNATFAGADNRPRWIGSNRINSNITSAIILRNQNESYAWDVSGSLERSFGDLFAKVAYSYGEAKSIANPGSIAFGSWNNNPHSGNPNTPGLGFSFNSPGHRVFAALTYTRDIFSFGTTQVSLFWNRQTIGNTSYTFAGDANGDGGTSNDLLYIPRNKGEMNFQTYTIPAIVGTGTAQNPQFPAVTFTREQQEDAWEAYIQQDKYLSRNRGSYVERNAIFLPMVTRADLSIAQDIGTYLGGHRNRLQVRLDVLNFSNLISGGKWGVSQRMVTNQPLTNPSADAQGRLQYRLRNINRELLRPQTFEATNSLFDVYRIQLGVRYMFN
jgi:hypothetical protein